MKIIFRLSWVLLLFCLFFQPYSVQSQEGQKLIDTARELASGGQFQKAEKMLSKALGNADENNKRAILWEKERIRRIRLDYNKTEKDILEQCNSRIKNSEKEELKTWEAEGKFDARIIDGEKRYVSPSVSNLAKRYPNIRKRFKSYSTKDPWGEKVLRMARRIQKASETSDSSYLVPLRLKGKHTLIPKPDYFKTGEMVHAWIPFPRQLPYQKDIKILNTSMDPTSIDDPESPIRSVYFETEAKGKKPPEFSIEYEFTRYAVYSKVNPEKVEPYGNDETYEKYTSEEPPNIIFTKELKDLAKKIVGDEQNPYLKGKKIYEWISTNIVYSFAREYSTLLNIPMYVYENRYGDCGQLGLLFITLCRIEKVPAAWRSGWECMGGEDWGMHDWCAVYVKPYGWIPVDPFMGVWVVHESTLLPIHKQFLLDFYYGNLDPWRLQANAKNNAELKPEKKHFRSETVDFQRGEIETESQNLYFGEFRWSMRLTGIEELPGEEKTKKKE